MNVDEDDRAYDALLARGLRSVPVTIVGDLVIRGYDPAASAGVAAQEYISPRRRAATPARADSGWRLPHGRRRRRGQASRAGYVGEFFIGRFPVTRTARASSRDEYHRRERIPLIASENDELFRDLAGRYAWRDGAPPDGHSSHRSS
jgi:hypothetical protein